LFSFLYAPNYLAIFVKKETIETQKDFTYSVNLVMNVISKLNPLEVLKNGYAIIEKDSKKILKSTNLKVGDEIVINTCDSKIAAQVKAIETKKEK